MAGILGHAEKMVTEFHNFVSDPVNNPFLLSVAVVLLSSFVILVLFAINSRKGRRQGILLLGLCDSGKTLLYSLLTQKRMVLTHTSIRENQGKYEIKQSKKATHAVIVDLPGHERIRTKYIKKYEDMASKKPCCCLFVVSRCKSDIPNPAKNIHKANEQRMFQNAMYIFLSTQTRKYDHASSSEVKCDHNEQEKGDPKEQEKCDHNEQEKCDHNEQEKCDHNEQEKCDHNEQEKCDHKEEEKGDHNEQEKCDHKEKEKGDHKEQEKCDHKEEEKGDHNEQEKCDHKEEEKGDHNEQEKCDHKEQEKGDHKEQGKCGHIECGNGQDFSRASFS
eukprot:gene7258-12944_t